MGSLARLSLLAVCALALALPSPAAAAVRLVDVSSPVKPRSTAVLTVAVTPTAATCRITVHYKSGPSVAAGLVPKRPAAGRITWSWTVGSRTTGGRWPIHVDCGAAGSLKTSFVVRR